MKRLTQKQHISVTHRSMGPQTIWWNRERYTSRYMYKSPHTHTHTHTHARTHARTHTHTK